MNFFFVGTLHPGSVVNLRAKALEELGNSLEIFNTHPYEFFGGRYVSFILRKSKLLNINHWLMNKRLVKRVIESKSDILWIDKGRYVSSDTIKKIRKEINLIIIYETLDYMFTPVYKTKHFISNIPQFDLIVTMRRDDVQYYQYGAKKVLVLCCCFYEKLYRPVKLSKREEDLYLADVVFCGNPQEETAESIAFLIDNGINVRIWGKLIYWKRMKCFKKLKPFIVDQYLIWEEYVKATNGAKIGLCFLRRVSQDEHTFRSLEIPACGTFMLAERTRDHMNLFEEDKEAVFFSNKEELLEKVRYYLKYPKEREEIAVAGRQRCIQSDYTFQWRYGKILDEAKKLRSNF